MRFKEGGAVLDNTEANASSHDDGARNSSAEYLQRARTAVSDGDALLGMHLYLAAFEEAAIEDDAPSQDALFGLKKAWALACSLKERSLAEYIYERMEPYLTADEARACAEELQSLALDKLEEYGLSRHDLEDMAQMITQDLMGVDAHVVKIDHIMSRALPGRRTSEEAYDVGGAIAALMGEVGSESDGSSSPAQDEAASVEEELAVEGKLLDSAVREITKRVSGASAEGGSAPAGALAKVAEEAGIKLGAADELLTYDNLAGYDSAIQVMRDFGIGMQDDEEFQQLIGLMNARHGLDRMPAVDTLLLRAPAREDANRFMEATLGELSLPTLRMRMEESLAGMPLLCVTAQTSKAVKMSSLREVFASGGVLVLEDIDTWVSPFPEADEGQGNFLMAQLTRGAREAIDLIRWAVDSPEVYVLATSATSSEIEGFFLELLEPMSLIDIENPTPEERIDIWMDLAREHPSMRGVNRADLVRLSANMPRFDIYMAAREALEEAYKAGLMARRYQPVTRDNLFDKLAAYQPLDSSEYHELEEAVICDFRSDLAHIDDLLRGE